MSRVYEVSLGCLLIVALWSWAITSLLNGWLTDAVWWSFFMTFCKVWTACLITAPLYREYLR